MEFDNEKIQLLNQNYSLFHPTIEQLSALYDMTKIVSTKIGLDWETMRNLTIKSTVDYQQKISRFHYEHRHSLPQTRIVVTSDIAEIIKLNLISLLKNQTKEDVNQINDALSQSFDDYMARHVNT